MALTKAQRADVKRRLKSKQRKAKIPTLEAVTPAKSLQADYYRNLNKTINALSGMVDRFLLPTLETYEARYAVKNSLGFLNVDAEKIIAGELAKFDDWVKSFDTFSITTARDMADKNEAYHKRKFVAEINKQFGINIRDHMSEYGVDTALRESVKANTALIKDLPKSYYDRISKTVFKGLTSGDDFASIRSELAKVKGISQRRAKLIAIDQTGKLMGKLNEVRQQNEGITSYLWDANLDARTRDDHLENDGHIFKWSDPTPGKAKGRPGEEIRCRCTGAGVLDSQFITRVASTPQSRADKDAIIARQTSRALKVPKAPRKVTTLTKKKTETTEVTPEVPKVPEVRKETPLERQRRELEDLRRARAKRAGELAKVRKRVDAKKAELGKVTKDLREARKAGGLKSKRVKALEVKIRKVKKETAAIDERLAAQDRWRDRAPEPKNSPLAKSKS